MLQAALFVAAVFGFPWILDLIAPLPSNPSLGQFLARFVPAVWAPTFAALLLIAAYDGRAALRREVAARFRYRRGAGHWLLIAVGLPAIAATVAVLLARATGAAAPLIPSEAAPTMIGMQLVTGAVGEEFGWRGFLLTRLATRLSVRASAWVMAVLWSLWHLPAWFDPTLPHHTFPMLPALLSVGFFGVFLAFVFDRSGTAVLATIAAHLSLNVAMGLGGAQLSSVVYWSSLTAVFGIAAVIATFLLPSESRFEPASRLSAT